MSATFSNSRSPFYKSAALFDICRIDDADFKAFRSRRFKTGSRIVSDEILDRILDIADRVSGDVQELCDALWASTEKGMVISESDVPIALDLVFAREAKAYAPIVTRLTDIQMRVLRGIASRGDAADAHVESMDGFIPIHPWIALRQWMDSRPPMDGSHRVNGWIATNPWMGGGKSIHGLTAPPRTCDRPFPAQAQMQSAARAPLRRRPRRTLPPKHIIANCQQKHANYTTLRGLSPQKSVTFLSQKCRKSVTFPSQSVTFQPPPKVTET